jgi:hypothetical protein
VEKLGVLFSEQLLLAALDLIDRDCGKENTFFQPIQFGLVYFTSGQLYFTLGPKPHLRPWHDRLLHRLSDLASILFDTVLLHVPSFRLHRTDIPLSDRGMCFPPGSNPSSPFETYLRSVNTFWRP